MKELLISEYELHTVATHNVYEDDERAPDGGTGILVFDTIVDWVSKYIIDRTGIGGYCWIILKSNNGHICRIVCAYSTCGNLQHHPWELELYIINIEGIAE